MESLDPAQLATNPSGTIGWTGPVGLGFRVPMLVVSPSSRGGLCSSDTFDHTALLRFLETRFGVEVPYISSWRREAVGDLTSAFNFAGGVDLSLPPRPDADALAAGADAQAPSPPGRDAGPADRAGPGAGFSAPPAPIGIRPGAGSGQDLSGDGGELWGGTAMFAHWYPPPEPR